MTKNIVAVFAAACGLTLVACDTPSDLRPEEKVSVDYVEPGTRNTYNIGTVNEVYDDADRDEVLLNHDPGVNELQKGDSIPETAETNESTGIENR